MTIVGQTLVCSVARQVNGLSYKTWFFEELCGGKTKIYGYKVFNSPILQILLLNQAFKRMLRLLASFQIGLMFDLQFSL